MAKIAVFEFLRLPDLISHKNMRGSETPKFLHCETQSMNVPM